MCETREFIMVYAVLASMAHLAGMAFMAVSCTLFAERHRNVARLVFHETERCIELAMSVYLFLAMFNFSKKMLRHFLIYLRCWVAAAIGYVALYAVLLLGFSYDIVAFETVELVKDTSEHHGHKGTGSFHGLAVWVILGIEGGEKEPRQMVSQIMAVARIMALMCVITIQVAYSTFLYWRLNLFSKTMPDADEVKLRPEQLVPFFAQVPPPPFAMPPPQYRMSPSQYAMQPQYGIPMPYELAPVQGMQPLYSVPSREQLQPYYAAFPQDLMPPPRGM